MALKLLYRTSLKLKSNKLFGQKVDRLEKRVMGLIVFIVYLRFFANLYFTGLQIKRGVSSTLLELLAFDYIHLYIIVLIFSFLLSAIDDSLICLNFKRLNFLNLSPFKLFLMQIFTLVNNPILLVIGLFILTALSPLLFLPGLPLSSIALLNITGAIFFLSWGLAFLVNSLPIFSSIKKIIKTIFILSLLFIVIANVDFRLEGGNAYIYSFERMVPLSNILRVVNNQSLVELLLYKDDSSHLFKSLLYSFLILLSALSFSFLTFNLLVKVRVYKKERRRSRVSLSLLGKSKTIFAILFKNDFLFLLAHPGLIISLLTTLSMTSYYLIFSAFSIQALFFNLLIILLLNLNHFTKSFHNDSKAIKRYKLYTIEWSKIVLAKNIALLSLLTLQLLPLMIYPFLVLDALSFIKVILISSLIITAYFSWGNFSSIFTGLSREKRANDNYLLNQIVGVAIPLTAFYLFFYVERYPSGIALLLILSAVVIILGLYLYLFQRLSAYLSRTI